MTPSQDTEQRPQNRARRGKRLRRAKFWGGGILASACIVCGMIFLFALERPMHAPDWLRDRIERQINQALPEGRLDLGTLTFELRPSLDVAVTIDNLSFQTSEGMRVFDLARLDAMLARRGLLQGKLDAKAVSASGLFLTVERSKDGVFNLFVGDGLGQTVPDLASVLARVDAAAEDPRLAALRNVHLEAVTLEYRDFKSQRGWLVDGGRFTVTRREDAISMRADVALLSGGADVATLALSASSPLGSQAMSLGLVLDNLPAADLATQSAALAWLGLLRAPISGALRMDVTPSGDLAPLNATLQIGAGVLQPSEATRPIPFEAARTYFSFDPAQARFDFSDVSVQSAWLTASGAGTAVLQTDAQGDLDGLTGQISMTRISGNPAALYENGPREVQDFQADLQVGFAPFTLRVGQISAQAAGLHLIGNADVVAGAEGWNLRAGLLAQDAKPAQLLSFWPNQVVPNTRSWVARNIIEGHFDDVQFRIDAQANAAPSIYVGAALRDAELQVLRSFPPLYVESGRLTLQDQRLVVVADAGHVVPGQGGRLDLSGTEFHILSTRARPGRAELTLRSQGSIEATLALLDYPPIEAMRRAGRSVDLASGQALLTTEIRFPLQPRLYPGDVDFASTGTLTQVSSTQLVPDRSFVSDALSVDVTPSQVVIAGSGRVSDVPFTALWQMPLGAPEEVGQASVEADVTISDAGLRAFGIALPPDTLRGAGRGQLRIDFSQNAPPVFSLNSNLGGVGLAIPALAWEMAPDIQGSFEIAGVLSRPPRIDRVALAAPGLAVEGQLTLGEGGGLERATLRQIQVGAWLDATGDIIPRGPGLPPAITLQSGALDLPRAPFARGAARRSEGEDTTASRPNQSAPDGSATAPLSLTLDAVRLTDRVALTDLQGAFDIGDGLTGDFTARINGGAPINGMAQARALGTAIDIRSDDAGAVLRDAQFFPNMVGGELRLKLRPTERVGHLNGELAIDQVRVRNAPAMAALLNAISIVGLFDEMTGQGIYFEEIDAAFQLGPDDVTLYQSSAVGPSMGISLDGYFDISRKIMDFQGVVSPLYAVNILGRVIARRGEGLIGINFNMQGPVDAPQVSVNPLSALTPGMFREIFRRPPPQVEE